MAWGYVQGAGADGSSTVRASFPCAYTSAVTAGNLLVAGVSFNSVDVTNLSGAITDTLGNTWFLATSATVGGSDTFALFYCQSTASGANTVTFTPHTSCGFIRIIVDEYAGNNLTFDVAASGAGNSGSGTTASANTSFLNELIYGQAYWFSAAGAVQGATFTPRETAATVVARLSMDKNGTSPGSYAVDATDSQPNPWGMVMATFYEAGLKPLANVTAAMPARYR